MPLEIEMLNAPFVLLKDFLYAAQDPYAVLLNYRSTPLANGYRPAELFMWRKIRTKILELPKNLQPILPHQLTLQEKERASRLNMKLNFDKHHVAKAFPILRKGDEVWLLDRKESGRVERQLIQECIILDCNSHINSEKE